MRPKIFVTGSSGFIGKNIIEQLGTKYKFVSPPHKDLDLLDSSRVDDFFKKNGYFDFVIHTAIIGGNRKVSNTFQIAVENLRMFFNVEKNKKHFGKMIHIGSGIEYGKEYPLKNMREEDFGLKIPRGNFGFYKYLCGKHIESTERIVNLRVFGLFGKYEDATIRFISNAICKHILGMPITINQNVYFDYLYVDDFIKILDYFLNHKSKYKSYNVTSGAKVDLLTITNKINRIAGRKSKIKITLKGLGNEYTANNSRLISEIGKFQFKKLDQAIFDLYNWYLSKKSELRRKEFLNDYF